jgi:hypothetical protein
MKADRCWKQIWEKRGAAAVSNDELHSGMVSCMEELAQAELLRFIQPQPLDILSDAGCGRSVNILLVHDRVRRIHEIDYLATTITHCHARIGITAIGNVNVRESDTARAVWE